MHNHIADFSALIVVDVQNDFCPGGALPVPDGHMVVPAINSWIQKFKARDLPVYFTRDWHPENHMSFKPEGGPWPVHCIQETYGARFHPEIHIPSSAVIISKGTDPHVEAYSGFQGTDLEGRLRAGYIKRLYIGGLATDYCVRSTVLDALNAGFEVVFLSDASKGVNVKPGDSESATEEMIRKGAGRTVLGDIE